MTPAVQKLKKCKIAYQLHQYDHEANATSYGLEAVEKLNLNSQQVFKTLVVMTADKQLAVAIVPVAQKLSEKLMAKALKVKKVAMAEAKIVESTTGYVLGGVSPIGQKKALKTIIDSSAKPLTSLFVSGGKRGLEIELSPTDLAKITRAQFEDIAI